MRKINMKFPTIPVVLASLNEDVAIADFEVLSYNDRLHAPDDRSECG